jgi:voltage-gated potassium channel
MKAFSILSRAIKSKKQEMIVSLQFLSIVTLILSFILFFVEHDVQPEVYNNGWRSVVWAFAQYIGDPGGFADTPPISLVGRLIACVIGVLGIAIFAVPAGLIGSAFTEVMEADNHEIEIEENKKKLHLAFERKLCRYTRLQIMPLNLSIQEIIAKMKLTENDIIEAVRNSENFRIINVATTVPVDDRPMDKLAIEHFFTNRPYGCMIDRGSKVTVVAPTSFIDPVIGPYSYYFAKLGGFNLVSVESGVLRPYKSYYVPVDNPPGLEDFLRDIETLSAKEGSWVVTLLPASGANEPELPSQIHISYGGKKGDESLDAPGVLINDKDCAKAIFKEIEDMLDVKFGIQSDRQYHDTSNPNIFLRKLSNIDSINGIIFRIAWSCMYWDSRRIQIAQSMAEIIKKHVEPEAGNEIDPELKVKGIAYEGHTI